VGVALVFGKGSTAPVNVTALGGQGLSLNGAFEQTNGLARSFDGAGDVTGDGVADVVIGAPRASVSAGPGRAYVLSVRPSPLGRLAELRFQIASFGLPARVRDRFFRKLDRIKYVYVSGDQAGACRRVGRLIALAQRLNGTRLTGA
jgi:hypothetical protein